jgi:hypothetical protein
MLDESIIESEYYYFWLVPSLISCSCSLFTLLDSCYIFRNVKKTMTFFDRQCALFSLADLLQCFSWFLGPRHDICSIQVYIFQCSILTKVFIGVLGSIILSYVVVQRKMPTVNMVRQYQALFSLIGIFCFAILCFFNSAAMFCRHHRDDPLSESSRLAYIYAFIVIVAVCYLIIVGLTIPCFFQHEVFITSALLSLTQRLKLYSVIFTLCVCPGGALLISVAAAHHFNMVLYKLTAICGSSSGTVFAFSHYIIFGGIHADADAGAGATSTDPTTSLELRLTTEYNSHQSSVSDISIDLIE